MNEWCRAASPSVNMIVADARGLYAQVFTDFGPKFTVVDTTGEAPITAMIASITSETSAVVTTLDEARHGLEDGSVIWQLIKSTKTPSNCFLLKSEALEALTTTRGRQTLPQDSEHWSCVPTQ